MKAGKLNRRIDIERKTVTQDETGQEIESWSKLSTRFASVMPARGSERFTADQFVASEQVEFRIRYAHGISDINPLDRIIYPAGRTSTRHIYDILSVLEIGRREGFKIIAARRPEIAIEGEITSPPTSPPDSPPDTLPGDITDLLAEPISDAESPPVSPPVSPPDSPPISPPDSPPFPDPIAPPTITAASAYVWNATTGQVYYTKGGAVYPAASLIKMATCLTLFQHVPLEDLATETVTITQAMIDLTTGTTMNIQDGDILTLDTCVIGAQTPSDNPACEGIAHYVGSLLPGGDTPREKFAAAANALAASLGCTDTTMVDPYGGASTTTARDGAILAKHYQEHPYIQQRAMWQALVGVEILGPNARTISVQTSNENLGDDWIIGTKSGSRPPQGVWNRTWGALAPNGNLLIGSLTNVASAAAGYADVRAVMAQLPIDFPELVHPAYNPATELFAGGAAGTWLDPSDMSTMFQDAAGTTPVTAVDQPVGRIQDKSGNGNHATQSSDAARPILRQVSGRWKLDFTGSKWMTFGIGRINGTGLFVDAGERFFVSIVAEYASNGADGALIARAGATTANQTFYMFCQSTTARPTMRIRGTTTTRTTPQINNGAIHQVHAFWDGIRSGFLGPNATFSVPAQQAARQNNVGSAAEETAEDILIGARTTSAPTFFLDGYLHQLVITDAMPATRMARLRRLAWFRTMGT